MTGPEEDLLAKASLQTRHLQSLAGELISCLENGENHEQVVTLQKQLSTGLIYLRSLYWDAQVLVNEYKDMTSASRQESDAFLLNMQNIYYQHRHLRSEIDQCEDLESKHESIGMVPEEQFLAENPQFKDLNPHQLILERIRDEEKRRLELFVIKTRLQETKTELSNQVKRIRSDIEDSDALNSELKRLSESATSLKKYFDKH